MWSMSWHNAATSISRAVMLSLSGHSGRPPAATSPPLASPMTFALFYTVSTTLPAQLHSPHRQHSPYDHVICSACTVSISHTLPAPACTVCAINTVHTVSITRHCDPPGKHDTDSHPCLDTPPFKQDRSVFFMWQCHSISFYLLSFIYSLDAIETASPDPTVMADLASTTIWAHIHGATLGAIILNANGIYSQLQQR
ncbi:hypothetical protein BGW80DRAFT_1257194 [Lactifluus volemus]|nr:hypothetical protein BGW80DRAFT_1257194 [Lactifluus volemus]